jgi:hypothetical protein
MNETEEYPRSTLIRESMIFQLKLIADGLRDFALVPVSLVATAIGLIRGGAGQDREFRRVIDLGKQTEQWINLFGQHEPIEEAGKAGSIDLLLSRAEDVVRQQASEGGMTEKASQAIQRALNAAHDKARESKGGIETDSDLDGDMDPGDRKTEI